MKSLATSLLLSTCLLAPAAAAPIYLPSGPQKDVSLSTVLEGGWTLCYSGLMLTPIGSAAEQVLQGCQGEYLMMAGRNKDEPGTLLALAATAYDEAILRTGRGNDTHVSNGAQWWFEPNWSWGFADASFSAQNQAINLFECNWSNVTIGMCLHTLSDEGGYRINGHVMLNDSEDYEKLFFVSGVRTPEQDGQVPLPSSLALLGLGLAGLGWARRRA